MGRFAAVLACLAACGRWGFSPAATPDSAGTADAGPDAAPVTLQCGSPVRFQVGAGAVSALATTATPNGFTMFTVDASGGLHGWGYEFVGTTLSAKFENTTIDTNATGTVAAASSDTALVLAAATGIPTATGTIVYPFDTSGVATGAPSQHAGELAIDTAVARSGVDGGFALATIAGGVVDARLVAANGSDATMPTPIAATGADTVSLASAGTGYSVAWGQTVAGKHEIAVELLDAGLNLVAGPQVVDDLSYSAYRGSIAWAESSRVYMASWHEKNSGSGDDVWISILGPDLSVVVPPKLVASNSHDPKITTDGHSFWMTWEVYATPAYLDGAQIGADGTVTARPVSMSGGTPGKWAMIDRDGQSVLVWTEVGGSGPDLYFDPMCSP
jgi:hypothetical protein